MWNTLLATTTYMSRLRISAVNDALCALALSFCAIRGIELSQQEFRSHGLPKGSRLRHSSLSRPSLLLSMAVTYTLVVHSFLLFGQAVQVPFLEEFVLLFYPEQVVRLARREARSTTCITCCAGSQCSLTWRAILFWWRRSCGACLRSHPQLY